MRQQGGVCQFVDLWFKCQESPKMHQQGVTNLLYGDMNTTFLEIYGCVSRTVSIYLTVIRIDSYTIAELLLIFLTVLLVFNNKK